MQYNQLPLHYACLLLNAGVCVEMLPVDGECRVCVCLFHLNMHDCTC